jgi:hypothetical protein
VLTIVLAAAAASGDLTQAFRQSFWWAIGFTAVGAVIALALPGKAVVEPAARE